MSSYFHSVSQSCPVLSANCRYNLRLFRLFRGDSSGMDKSSSVKCLLYSDVVKGEPSPTGRGRRSRDDQSRSWRYSFQKKFYNFFLFISFFQLLYSGAYQMEPPSPIQALGVNPFPSRFIIRTVPRGDFARRRWEEPITTTK